MLASIEVLTVLPRGAAEFFQHFRHFLVLARGKFGLKLPFALWSREAVGQLIAQMTGIQLSLTAIGGYLAA
jgi:hypothetical protein